MYWNDILECPRNIYRSNGCYSMNALHRKTIQIKLLMKLLPIVTYLRPKHSVELLGGYGNVSNEDIHRMY